MVRSKGKGTDRVISDRIVVNALLLGAQAIVDLSDEEIAKKYARQEQKITRERANTLRQASLDVIQPVIEAVAQRGGIDYKLPQVKRPKLWP